MALPDGQGGAPEGANETGEQQPDITLTPAPENQPGGAAPSPEAKTTEDAKATTVPDAGTTPAVDPAAAQAPMTDKTVEEKLAADAGPAQTGTAPPDDPAAKPADDKPAPKAERPARPAKEPEPKTAPKVPPPAGSVNETLAAAVAGVSFEAYLVPDLPLGAQSVAVEVQRDDIPAVLAACHNDDRLSLKYMRCLSGVDWQEEGLEVVYHLYSFEKKHKLTVKTRVPYDDANVPSVSGVYRAAEWHEREARDMFGITFTGHPDPRPLLLPDDMTDHFPLRKDNPLQEIEEWQGENLREGAGEDE